MILNFFYILAENMLVEILVGYSMILTLYVFYLQICFPCRAMKQTIVCTYRCCCPQRVAETPLMATMLPENQA
jgi:hypothetical protein